jgi:tRNA dimethylallyltransferase
MLYLKALVEGLDALPAADAEIRADLDQQAAERGWPALHAELARIDPVTAARLAPADAQRIQRALEVWHLSGRPLSSFHRPADRPASPLASMPMISLEPLDRAWLHQRIARRVDLMIDQGLEAEVAALMARGDLYPELPSMRCVGYRQTWSMLQGQIGRELWREQVVAATRQLAKRQLTWLRSWPNRTVIACDSSASGALEEAVLQRITTHLSA